MPRTSIPLHTKTSNGFGPGDWVWAPVPLNPGKANQDAPFLALAQVLSLTGNPESLLVEYAKVTSEDHDGTPQRHRAFCHMRELQHADEPSPSLTQMEYFKAQPHAGLAATSRQSQG